MQKIITQVVAVCGCLFISGCSIQNPPSASTSEQAAAKTFSPKLGQAGVYVFREDSFVGSLGSYFVYLDGRLLGLCRNKVFLYKELPPGRYTFSPDLTQYTDTAIEVAANRIYYLKIPAVSGISMVKPFRLVPAAEGRSAVISGTQSASRF